MSFITKCSSAHWLPLFMIQQFICVVKVDHTTWGCQVFKYVADTFEIRDELSQQIGYLH